MFSITVAMGRGQPIVWTLLFRDATKYESALKMLRSAGDINIADEFGQILCTKGGDIVGMLAEDMDQSRGASIERTLHEMRLRQMLQARVQADSGLKFMLNNQGPAVLNPMSGFPRN